MEWGILRMEEWRLTCEQQKKELEDLKMKLSQTEKLASQVIWAIANAIDAKDTYTGGHSVRVAEYAWKLSKKLNKDSVEQKKIFYVSLLHDIGKVGIPDRVLNKPGKLDDEEFAIIKKHPTIGSDILSMITAIPDIALGARWHHERFDGRGYPDGKAGEEIPEVARIIAVADAYDAMSSCRSYRGAMPQEAIYEEIRKGRGTQFDPVIADKMLELMDEDMNYEMHG